jgi:RNA polymerase sigma-70 factor, ECF subfamily
MNALDSFETVRPRLYGIASRVTGNAAEADDVVQDAWIRWQGTDRSVVRDAPAFLATSTARLAINVTQSARVRRETHLAAVPEPVDPRSDPAIAAEEAEEVELALRTLSEKLGPTERAAFVMREAFDYPYREISHAVGVSEANARQLVTRARQRLAA